MTLGRSKAAKQAKEITFHSDRMGCEAHPAIKVKYYGDAPSEYAWDRTVDWFWFNAQNIAHQHGYSGVFGEGRSSGWVVPYTQTKDGKVQQFGQWPGQGPSYGYPTYPDVTDAKQRKQFIRFQKDILFLFDTVPTMLKDYAAEGESR